jgi:hypothetical protein
VLAELCTPFLASGRVTRRFKLLQFETLSGPEFSIYNLGATNPDLYRDGFMGEKIFLAIGLPIR